MNKEYLQENPDYITILENLIEYEKNNINPDHSFIEDKEYDSCWRNTEVGAHPSRLYQLEVNGFLERVMDSNTNTSYSLKDREKIEEMVNSISITEDGHMVEMHEFPDELPDNLFDEVIGYDDVKWLLERAITTDEITNVIMIGPPGSAKTVFLMCLRKLEDSRFMSGGPTTGPAVLDVMFEEKPRLMLIDEMDDMEGDTQEVLSQYTETGIVDETKMGKKRSMQTNTKTFGSANEPNDVLPQIRNRFLDLHFDPYTRDEYLEICEHMLPKKESVSKSEARTIGELIWDMEGEGDVRKSIQVARVSRGDPERVVDVLEKYSDGTDNVLSSLAN